MDTIFLGITGAQWIDLGISLIIVLIVLLLGRSIVRVLIEKPLKRITSRTETVLDDAILNILRVPLYLLSLVLATEIAYKRLEFLPESWQSWTGNLFYILYLVVGFVFAWRFVQNFFIWYGKEMSVRTETDLDEQLMPFFRRIAMIILWMIGIITLLGHFEVDVSAMVTTLGIGSLAIALAAQESLSDTISGFIIMIDRPFRIGDRIEIQDLDTWGDVIDIGLRSSRIRTRDNRMVIVPNSVIGKSLVVNYSYPDTQYRIQIHIGLGYGIDIEEARRVMVDAIRGVEGVLPDKPVEALFLEFGDSALVFRVRWWLDSYYDTRRMFDKVNTALYYALNEAGIEIPNPQIEVLVKDKTAQGDGSNRGGVSDVLR
jgi:small-conductance mechanosensitive channel